MPKPEKIRSSMAYACKKHLFLEIGGFFLSSAALLLWPVQLVSPGAARVVPILVGLLFWAGLALGVANARLLNRKAKDLPAPDTPPPRRWVFTNRLATWADILFLASLALAAALELLRLNLAPLACTALFLLLFSLEMRFVLNGKSFNHIFGNNLLDLRRGKV